MYIAIYITMMFIALSAASTITALATFISYKVFKKQPNIPIIIISAVTIFIFIISLMFGGTSTALSILFGLLTGRH